MYAFVDRPVTELDAGGRLLVWAMRLWVKAVGERKCPGNALAPAFAGLAVLPGLQPFMAMMALFNRHGLENFQFCALPCNHVSEHEALILTLVCTMPGATPKTARDTLELLVAEEAVAPLVDAVARLGKALGAVGMHPQLPDAAAPQQASGSVSTPTAD
ncbi:MAG TPA: hypothetical protein VFF98_16150 [Novosphingobium sp.]|nr:hypothetical protein [Novosphingobium sp.]